MGFDAGSAVVALDWDLRPFVDAHGTVPEPSQAKLDAYSGAMLGIFTDMGLDLSATASEDDIEQALTGELTRDKTLAEAAPAIMELRGKITASRIKAAVKVCGGSPTAAQITSLPPRVREAFLGWCAGWAADPTSPQDASSPSPALSRNGASAT